jgi:hypothetical protein
MRRFAQSRLRFSKICSARPEPLDLEKAFSTVSCSVFLGILILYLFVSTDISPRREIQFDLLGQQYGCTRSLSFNGTRSMDQIIDHNLSYGRFCNSNSSVYEFLPVDSMPVHRYIQSNPPSFETFICVLGNLRILFWAASSILFSLHAKQNSATCDFFDAATHLFLAVAELWFLVRFVCPRSALFDPLNNNKVLK